MVPSGSWAMPVVGHQGYRGCPGALPRTSTMGSLQVRPPSVDLRDLADPARKAALVLHIGPEPPIGCEDVAVLEAFETWRGIRLRLR